MIKNTKINYLHDTGKYQTKYNTYKNLYINTPTPKVKNICRELFIAMNKLYQIFHINDNCDILDYVYIVGFNDKKDPSDNGTAFLNNNSKEIIAFIGQTLNSKTAYQLLEHISAYILIINGNDVTGKDYLITRHYNKLFDLVIEYIDKNKHL